MRRPRWLRWPRRRREVEAPFPGIEGLGALQRELNERRAAQLGAMIHLLEPDVSPWVDLSRPFEVRVEAGSLRPPGMGALLDAIEWRWPAPWLPGVLYMPECFKDLEEALDA